MGTHPSSLGEYSEGTMVDEVHFETTSVGPQFRYDFRVPNSSDLDEFIIENPVRDWSTLRWADIGRPFRVENMSDGRRAWEEQNGDTMPVKTSWEMFNRSFHEWFSKDVPKERSRVRHTLAKQIATFRWNKVSTLFEELTQLSIWNFAHRIQDSIWDPRGKRALFRGLDVEKPRILFLGAAEGYEAMQLSAMYPGGEAVLVDYDEFCKTHRYGQFPEDYPFLGHNLQTGGHRIWHKSQMNTQFIVDDIRNLPFGKEFDIVISVGLIEHFPDEFKPEAIDFHRRFLKPGGYAIMTTPKFHWKTRLFYHVMADAMNYTYRELMTVQQMGMYVFENGFNILRHGVIKSHNGLIAKPR
ncbi:class I SAM-dependent methyltransferase [Alicyclobacillus dauci]|uniref:Class I SAM-dependent methyltransferase n=1 Tax=Alicyclobacillus dauci TaxID=1475485 RepID=A0ABY6Z638_9BACL|nr:class I SAM-dependent methyltransferase [Alicyclobacillus dauci]WAH38215.1 class I SAM-dependent methyltransferase [Alicyclobacillus dauci]